MQSTLLLTTAFSLTQIAPFIRVYFTFTTDACCYTCSTNTGSSLNFAAGTDSETLPFASMIAAERLARFIAKGSIALGLVAAFSGPGNCLRSGTAVDEEPGVDAVVAEAAVAEAAAVAGG